MEILNDEIIKALKDIFIKCESVERVMLFGSRARGDNKERSDYDVAVFGNVSEEDKLEIFLRTEDLPTLLKIDVAYVDELDQDKFVANILKEGIIFYDRT